ncbi:hypothetical protein [Argonema antarcticum]|uniref:hypothetical protein n=1 Tax=Argonema antarcticum TaxID=2942763 RepID=UPI0020120C4F|nr:hypothetical protein [Argonema antarcticum]MCL1469487.1 hypothetical protein [Argonema antarcticum A004/B2]
MTFKQSITAMKGIQFVVDDTGEKTAVIIDLAEWGEVWESLPKVRCWASALLKALKCHNIYS